MLSDSRQTHWLHLIIDRLEKKNLIAFQDKSKVIRSGMRAMNGLIQTHNQIEKKVSEKIASLKRSITPHSNEWNVLFQNYFEEELSRSHLGQRKAPPSSS